MSKLWGFRVIKKTVKYAPTDQDFINRMQFDRFCKQKSPWVSQ